MNLAATMTLNAGGFTGPLASARSALTGFTGPLAAARGAMGGFLAPFAGMRSVMGGIIGPLAAVTGGILSVHAAVSTLKASIGAAARMEDFEAGFRTLLGSADAAKKRLSDLAKFAETTPFELPELVSASRLLQAFTGSALATGAGLRLVGDAAASVNQPLDAVTMWMGRLYAGLKDGQPLGEPIQNLTQLGLVSGATRKALLSLQGQTLSNARVMTVLQEAFGKSAGAMDALSRTYNGKMSNLKDAWGAVQRAFGEPVRDALKPYLDAAIARLSALVPVAQRVGRAIAAGLALFRTAWSDGSLGKVVELSLTVAFGSAVNVFVAGMVSGVAVLSKALSAAVDNLGSIGLVMQGAGAVFGAALLQGLTRPLAYIQAAMDKALDIGSIGAKDMARNEAIVDLRANDPRFKGRSDDELRLNKRFIGMAGDQPINRVVPVGSFDKEFSAAIEARVANLNTIEERAKKIMAEGGPRFGFGGVSMNASQIMGEAQNLMRDGLTKLREPAAKFVSDIVEIVKQFRVGDITGASAAFEELKKRIAALPQAAAQASATADSLTPAAGTGGTLATIASDRLAKIGLFVGGAGGPAVDYARRTAVGVEKLHALIRSSMIPTARPIETGYI